jgi:hypothetical protein
MDWNPRLPLVNRRAGERDPSRRHGKPKRANGEVWPSSLPLAVHRSPATPPAGREICLLVGYAPDGRPTPALAGLLDALAAEEIDCYVCLALNSFTTPLDMTALGAAAAVFGRANGGYDFAIWASVLNAYPEIWEASRFICVNDSIIGPIGNFREMMRRLRASPADFIALTESYESGYHTQSYFFAFQNRALQSTAVREFWQRVRVEREKLDVIRKYELTLFDWVSREGGLKAEVLFSYEQLFPGADLSKPIVGNPTHHLWERLLLRGFPFIKAELLHRNPAGVFIQHWEAVLQPLGYDTAMCHAHLAEMDRTRGTPSRRKPIMTRNFKRFLKLVLGTERFERLRRSNRLRLQRRRVRLGRCNGGMEPASKT